ncbi:MAG: hypothetical protein KIT84_28155 [Labilithrix sp.]|nr:hypothetical protein [Labilithrix sp.]MCW5814932.1 hypothetical protein [Labilithrix sp.]
MMKHVDEATLKARWLDATGASIGVDHSIFEGVAWGALEVFDETGASLPYALASLTGSRRPPYAFGFLENACFHQTTVAASAKPVARVLVAILDAELGSREEILSILTGLPFGRFLSNAQKKKYNLGGSPAAADGRHRGMLKHEGAKWFCDYGMKDGKLDGPFVSYWEEDRKAWEGTYEAGRKIGRWRQHHAKGWLEREGDFSADAKTGAWSVYESFGKKLREETYAKNKLHGPFRAYYFNGKPKEEGQYVAGKKDGPWTEWHFSGAKKRESTFAKGKERGPARAWDESGNEIAP